MLKSKEIKISVIIVNYKSEHYLDRCLASVYGKSKEEKCEVIIVNNDSEAKLEKIAAKYKQIRLFNRKSNKGFGNACNYGAKRANGNLLFFLNPDTQFLSDYIGHILAKFSKADQDIAIIGPRLVTDSGETQLWCAGKELTLGQRIKNKLGLIESKKIWESKEDIISDWVSGSALTIKKKVFNKIGGFDGKIFMYGEDLDLCDKVRDLGYKILYCPEKPILHSGGKSREGIFRQKLQYFRSSFYYIKKRIRRR